MKKVFWICLVFLFFGTTFAFSQNVQVRLQMKCRSLISQGTEWARNITSVNYYAYDNNTFMLNERKTRGFSKCILCRRPWRHG